MRLYCITGFEPGELAAFARLGELLGAEMLSERAPVSPPQAASDAPERHSTVDEINDRLLARLGAASDVLPALAPGWEHDRALDDLRNAARDLIAGPGADAGLIALTGARGSFLLPFWFSVAPVSGTVLVTRDPGDAAAAATAQANRTPEHSSALWLRYVTAAWLGGEPRLVLDYRDLFNDLPGVVRRLASFLGTDEPDGDQLEDIKAVVEEERGDGSVKVAPSPIGSNLALAYTVHDLLTTDHGRDLTPLFRALQDGLLHAPEAVTNGDESAPSAADVARLRRELHDARTQARQAERRYSALRKSRSVRAARWGAQRMKPVLGLVRQVRARSRGARVTTGASAPAAARRTLPQPVTSDVNVEAQLTRLEQLAARPHVTVIIPIFNAHDELLRCLASVERNATARDSDILLIDDGSTDRRIGELLDDWEQRDGVRVLRNDRNLGFTRTVNLGYNETRGDVVLLNSDCEVTPRWLQNLIDCAYRNPRIATVTPVSDNAGAFSVPEVGVANDRPRHLTADEVGRVISRTSARVHPTVPTGNGFCMYIKRAALEEVGLFDAESFPRGYGEEGDFCMRARAAGWTNVVDDATIVFHQRSASFGTEKDELLRAGRMKLDELHPDYTQAVRAFVHSNELDRIRADVRAAYDDSAHLRRRIRPRILYVLHRGTGGTPETNADLMGALLGDYEPFLLTSDTKALELSRFTADGAELIERWVLPDRLRADEFSNPRYRATVADMLTRYCIDLVHIRLLLAHTFDLPSVARALDIPVVLSFHDFFLVCPTVHLLDDADQFCGGICTPGDGECRIPSDWVKGVVPHLKHSWVKVWQEGVSRMIPDVDAFVTTSPTARDIYTRTYPALSDAPFHLIEHGRDLPFEPVDIGPDLRAPVRIAIPGALDVHKGAAFIEQLVALDTDKRLEFHFLGKVPEAYQHLGVMHGGYERNRFAEKMREIRPAFVGILSIWAETYSHTLSEAWAAGLPVLVTDLGAPKERVEQHGGGWILDHSDPRRAYERILEICDDEAQYRRVRAEANTRGIRPLRAMADDYDALYRSTLLTRRTVPRSDLGKPPRVRRAALFVLGSSYGRPPPSAHVRMLRRLGHPLVRPELATRLVEVEDFINGPGDDPDLAIVQRTAIPPERLDAFLATVTARDIPLVVDIDDNLFAIDPSDSNYDEYKVHLASLERLIAAADLVTVSTEVLRDAIAGRAQRVAVVPNMLDEFLWFGDTATPVADAATPGWAQVGGRLRSLTSKRPGPSGSPTCNLVYVGTRTHADDLALLRPVMERLRRRRDVDVRLFVVGVEEDRSPGETWYERVSIPTRLLHYPYADFVPWLRSRASAFDVALAPLRDTAFNRGKSDLKFLEYAALGLPGVFSDVVPYNQSIRHDETGLLTENTTDAWCAAILRLADDAMLRQRIAAAATDYVLAQRCLQHDALSYARLLSDVAAAASTSTSNTL